MYVSTNCARAYLAEQSRLLWHWLSICFLYLAEHYHDVLLTHSNFSSARTSCHHCYNRSTRYIIKKYNYMYINIFA